MLKWPRPNFARNILLYSSPPPTDVTLPNFHVTTGTRTPDIRITRPTFSELPPGANKDLRHEEMIITVSTGGVIIVIYISILGDNDNNNKEGGGVGMSERYGNNSATDLSVVGSIDFG